MNWRKSFIQHYGDATGKQFLLTQSLVLSVTDRATPPQTMAPGRLRLATQDDQLYLPYWCADFQRALRKTARLIWKAD